MTWTDITPRRGVLLTAATLPLAAATAWLSARSHPAFRDVLEPVQLATSVLVPFFGVLAVTTLHRPPTNPRPAPQPPTAQPPPAQPPAAQPPAAHLLVPRLLVPLGLAAGFAVAGTLLAAMATGWPPVSRAATLLLASVLVQMIAQLVGTGCGLLLWRPALAMAATIVVPMGVTVLLGTIDPSGGLVRWLTPYGNAHALLMGRPSVPAFAVVVLLWCVVPNLLGTWRLNRAARRQLPAERF
ncbi:hypothetical protein [Actinoplanes sp. NPDC026619]|uniref:hypothetical protein n=1 Tax=Actinoplanes sp. NPDC026619 TaxID=3155798 RepID=UPI00340A51F8